MLYLEDCTVVRFLLLLLVLFITFYKGSFQTQLAYTFDWICLKSKCFSNYCFPCSIAESFNLRRVDIFKKPWLHMQARISAFLNFWMKCLRSLFPPNLWLTEIISICFVIAGPAWLTFSSHNWRPLSSDRRVTSGEKTTIVQKGLFWFFLVSENASPLLCGGNALALYAGVLLHPNE